MTVRFASGTLQVTAFSSGAVRHWEIFRSVKELLEVVCKRVPRRLTRDEERSYALGE
jgi:hypothetical protein